MTIIIGNSDMVLQREMGHNIDMFEKVVRCNRAPIAGFQKYVGSKQTVRFMNPELFAGSVERGQCEMPFEQMAGERIFANDRYQGEMAVQLARAHVEIYPRNAWMTILSDLGLKVDKSHHPTIGLDAILHNLGCTIYGFDIEDGPYFHHYWRPELRKTTFHKFNYEKWIIRELLNQNKIYLLTF